MKTSSKLSIISAIAALAIVGTGFAAWQFSNDASVSAAGNVAITDKAEAGTLTVSPESFVLTLDQDFLGWQTALDDNGLSDISKVELKYKGSESNQVKEKIDFSCAISNELSSYITIGDGAFAASTMDYAGEEISNEYTLPAVSWVEGKKPTTQKAYDDMVTALGNKKVTFAFSAEVEE